MKNMRKTLLCVVLALAFVLGMSPMTSFAESEAENVVTMIDDFISNDSEVPQDDNNKVPDDKVHPQQDDQSDNADLNKDSSVEKTITTTKTVTKHAPKTGDNQTMALWIVLMLTALVVFFTVRGRRKHHR